jgi:hypothetical protein
MALAKNLLFTSYALCGINPKYALEKLKKFLSIASSFSWGFMNIMNRL